MSNSSPKSQNSVTIQVTCGRSFGASLAIRQGTALRVDPDFCRKRTQQLERARPRRHQTDLDQSVGGLQIKRRTKPACGDSANRLMFKFVHVVAHACERVKDPQRVAGEARAVDVGMDEVGPAVFDLRVNRTADVERHLLPSHGFDEAPYPEPSLVLAG